MTSTGSQLWRGYPWRTRLHLCKPVLTDEIWLLSAVSRHSCIHDSKHDDKRVTVIVVRIDRVVSQDGGEYDFIVVGAGSAGSRALSLREAWMLLWPYLGCMKNIQV